MKALLPAGLLGVALLAAPAPISAAEAEEPAAVPVARRADLRTYLAGERPTVITFLREGGAADREFLRRIRSASGPAAVRVAELRTLQEPLATQYEVTRTPLALVYDRRGRLLARTDDIEAAEAALARAADILRIDWPDPDDPRYLASKEILGRPTINSGILRTMTPQPEFLKYMHALSQKAHFEDGYLDRRTKELIATYVSALNKCKY